MNWFEYLECAVLSCIAIVEIIVLTLLYRHRKKKKKQTPNISYSFFMFIRIKWCSGNYINSYHFRTNFSTCGGHCVVLYPLLRQINLLLYHYNIDSRSVFSVLLKHKIPYCMACWKTIKVSCVHLCDFIYHLVLFCVSFCFQAYRMDTSLPNYVYSIFHLGYDVYDIYIVQVIITYFYIFRKCKKKKEIMKEQTNKLNDREHFRLLIPTMVIASFISFFCIPDFVNMFFHFHHVEDEHLAFNILGVSYRIAWLADTLIYIYNYKILPKNKIHPWSQTLWRTTT